MFSTTTGTVNQFTCSKYVDNYSFDIPFSRSSFVRSLGRLSLPRTHMINTRAHTPRPTPTPARAHAQKSFFLFFFFTSATSLLTTSRVSTTNLN